MTDSTTATSGTPPEPITIESLKRMQEIVKAWTPPPRARVYLGCTTLIDEAYETTEAAEIMALPMMAGRRVFIVPTAQVRQWFLGLRETGADVALSPGADREIFGPRTTPNAASAHTDV